MSAQPLAVADLVARGIALSARPMRGADLDAVLAVERSVYPFPWTRGNFADSLVAGYDAWVFEQPAAQRGRFAAYAVVMWIPDEAHLLNLSVEAELQRRGIGAAVLDWLMSDAAARGARTMLLEVRPSNAPAIALYRSRGFAQIGTRRGYYPAADGAREDGWVLSCRLADG